VWSNKARDYYVGYDNLAVFGKYIIISWKQHFKFAKYIDRGE